MSCAIGLGFGIVLAFRPFKFRCDLLKSPLLLLSINRVVEISFCGTGRDSPTSTEIPIVLEKRWRLFSTMIVHDGPFLKKD